MAHYQLPATITHFTARVSCVLATMLVLVSPTVLAASAISQGFTITGKAPTAGTLMDLKANSQNTTEAATSQRVDQLLGVVGNKPLVELGGGSKQVQVVISGLTSTMVSDINGNVKVGDKITASPLTGIGMKAVNSTQIVGTAQANLSSVTTTTQTIKDREGAGHTVKIGVIPVQVNVTYYAASQDKLNAVVPSFLLTLGSAIAGRNVSALRVLIGFLALLLGFAIVGIMLQSAVRSGIIAIGRNPLAQRALRKGMLEVSLTAVGILLLTMLAIYIILTT